MNDKSGDDMAGSQEKMGAAKDSGPPGGAIPTPQAATTGAKPQTIFIHKLYDMLEDEHISHLIWWTANGESFCLLPGEEFSKVLAQYFKHTNIASFIRQLNMYGFHKVNDQGQGDTDPNVARWEFRHLANNFRKGDIESLKLIKRRSSKNVAHAKETTGKGATTVDDDIQELSREHELHMPETHEAMTHEQQQHYHQTLQLQQQDQVPRPPHSLQQHPVGARDNMLPANVLPQVSKLPHRYPLSNETSQDTVLELTHNLNALRQDYHHLQAVLDIVLNEQMKSQFDLIQLVEIMQRHGAKDDNKTLDYEFTNFKQVLLNKFNNMQALVSQQKHHPLNANQQHPRPQGIYAAMTPQLFSSSHNPFTQGPPGGIDSHVDIDGQDKKLSVNTQKPPHLNNIDSKQFSPITKEGQVSQLHPERFLDRRNVHSLNSPHASEMRNRSSHQYPFPIMHSDSRKSIPSGPEVFGSAKKQGIHTASSVANEQRPPSIPTPNSSLSVSRPLLSNSSGSSGSLTSTYSNSIPAEGRPRPSPLPSVSELDKLIKEGNGLPFYSLMNNYESLKRKSISDDESRKRKS